MSAPKPTVAHVHGIYLNLTENWIYHQIRFLREVRSIFLAKRSCNLDQFPFESLYVLAHQPLLRRQWSRLIRPLLGYYPFYRDVCRREGVRLLHAHSGLLGRSALPLAEKLSIPLLTSFYGFELTVHPEGEEGLRREYRELFSRGSAFIAEGPAAREQLIRIGCAPEKLYLHRLGIDPREIPFVERDPVRDGVLRMLIAARFDEKKGLPYAVEAFCRIAQKEPGVRLTIVGDANASPEQRHIKQELHRLVRDYDVSDRVRFEGFLPLLQLRSLAYEHHLLLHPSVRASNGDTEGGHPVILTEMAASGMPIITTWHCDIPEVVVHGETGWLCAERSIDDLVAALEDAWAKRECFPEIGRRARALVETKYNGRRNTLDPLYGQILSSGS